MSWRYAKYSFYYRHVTTENPVYFFTSSWMYYVHFQWVDFLWSLNVSANLTSASAGTRQVIDKP